MREDLLPLLDRDASLASVDHDFVHLFVSWFNRGFLVLSRISWSSPASILEKIIHYEAVHEIKGWEDLRRRLDPHDRRCFAFFHPALVDEPLIFVEVALDNDIPGSIHAVLESDGGRKMRFHNLRSQSFIQFRTAKKDCAEFHSVIFSSSRSWKI